SAGRACLVVVGEGTAELGEPVLPFQLAGQPAQSCFRARAAGCGVVLCAFHGSSSNTRSPHNCAHLLAQASECDSIHILSGSGQLATRRRERTNWWWPVKSRRTVASPATRAAKALPPSSMYMTTS